MPEEAVQPGRVRESAGSKFRKQMERARRHAHDDKMAVARQVAWQALLPAFHKKDETVTGIKLPTLPNGAEFEGRTKVGVPAKAAQAAMKLRKKMQQRELERRKDTFELNRTVRSRPAPRERRAQCAALSRRALCRAGCCRRRGSYGGRNGRARCGASPGSHRVGLLSPRSPFTECRCSVGQTSKLVKCGQTSKQSILSERCAGERQGGIAGRRGRSRGRACASTSSARTETARRRSIRCGGARGGGGGCIQRTCGRGYRGVRRAAGRGADARAARAGLHGRAAADPGDDAGGPLRRAGEGPGRVVGRHGGAAVPRGRAALDRADAARCAPGWPKSF